MGDGEETIISDNGALDNRLMCHGLQFHAVGL